MIATRPYIIYTLPQSRTTQALIGGKIEKAWANVEHFLSNCTTADFNNPTSIYLMGYTAAADHGEHPELAEKVIKRTRQLFGLGVTEPFAYLYPSNTPTIQTKTKWQLTAKDLYKALKFIESEQPLPKYNLGPIELIVSYDFKLLDLVSRIELPNQQFISSVLLWLKRGNCVAPSLCFPFEEPGKQFWDYANNMEKLLPFKFYYKFLRLGRANKRGTSNMFSKL